MTNPPAMDGDNPAADLFISKTDGVAAVVPNTNTTYTVMDTTNGPSEVTNVVVVDTAPAGVRFGTWSCAVTNPTPHPLSMLDPPEDFSSSTPLTPDPGANDPNARFPDAA